MAKYIVFEDGKLPLVNSLDAAKAQALELAVSAPNILVAEVILRFKTEVKIKEVVAE